MNYILVKKCYLNINWVDDRKIIIVSIDQIVPSQKVVINEKKIIDCLQIYAFFQL